MDTKETAGTGWNSWNVDSPAALIYLPDGLQIRFGLFDTLSQQIKNKFNWRDGLHRLGQHSSEGLYSEVELQWEQTKFSFEYSSSPDRLVSRITSTAAGDSYKLFTVEFNAVPSKEATPLEVVFIEREDRYLVRVSNSARTWWFRFFQPVFDVASLNLAIEPTTGSCLFFKPSEPLVISGWLEENSAVEAYPVSSEEAINWLETRKQAASNTSLSSSGWLGEAATALERVVNWNTIRVQATEQLCTVVSRDWCGGDTWGSYVLFGWDSFFNALMAAQFDPELAIANVKAILNEITTRGFVPNFGSGLGRTEDRSQPPVGAYCVLKLSKFFTFGAGNEYSHELLEQTFDPLLRWHKWWKPNRDGNKDGLLEWGSNPLPDYRWGCDNIRAAMWESGMDNSPMYDGVTFNRQTHTMELADVGLNSLYALDAWALSQIAQELGYQETASQLQQEYEDVGQLINRELWSEDAGIYQNKHWDGRFSPALSPTLFYPLIAGVVPADRARRMVEEHLLNPNEFWANYVVPSVARNSAGYLGADLHEVDKPGTVSDYWRGRIWPPLNFLVSEGLRRYHFDEIAHELARRSLKLFLGEWTLYSHIHENYHPETGTGDDVPNSEPIYTWGALLALLGMQELADAEACGGWRFGNYSVENAALKNVCTGAGLLDVTTGIEGLSVSLNHELLVTVDQSVIVRHFHKTGSEVSCTISGPVNALTQATENKARVRLGQLPANKSLSVTADDILEVGLFSNDSGQLELSLRLPLALKVSWN